MGRNFSVATEKEIAEKIDMVELILQVHSFFAVPTPDGAAEVESGVGRRREICEVTHSQAKFGLAKPSPGALAKLTDEFR